MVVKAGRRHILLGRFPVPLSTLSTRVTHDVVIPLFGPQLGPTQSQIRAGSDTGSSRAVSPWSGKESSSWIGASRTWGLEEFKRRPSPVPHLQPRAWIRAEEAVSCVTLSRGGVFLLGEVVKSEAQKGLLPKVILEPYGHLRALREAL